LAAFVYSLGLLQTGNIGEVPEVLRVIKPISHKKFVGRIETYEPQRARQVGCVVLVEESADLDRRWFTLL
jgi:hypothetical protein